MVETRNKIISSGIRAAKTSNLLIESFFDEVLAYKDSDKLMMVLKRMAKSDSEEAHVLLGYAYYYGVGVVRNIKTAMKCWHKAALKKQRLSQFYLGLSSYLRGKKNDYKNAFVWFKKSADQGCSDAQYFLGRMYEYGEGVEGNLKHAIFWYKESAKKSNGSAENALAYFYEKGIEVGQDFIKAFFYYKKAALHGDDLGQFNLALVYEKGELGIKRNYKSALNWYLQSANQGYAEAQCNLGIMYLNGNLGLQKDYVKAQYWFSKAAKQGDKKAEFNLKLIKKTI